MSDTFAKVKGLVAAGKSQVTEHSQESLLDDGIDLDEILESVSTGQVIEDYPDAFKGPSVLLLQMIRKDLPVHALWGLSKSNENVASLITVYFPAPEKWYDGFIKRRPK